MGGDVEIRPLVHGEGLEDIKRVGIETRRRSFVHVDLDDLVGTGRLERRVEGLRCGDDIARPQRPGPVRPRPKLEDDVLCMGRSHRTGDRGGADEHGGE